METESDDVSAEEAERPKTKTVNATSVGKFLWEKNRDCGEPPCEYRKGTNNWPPPLDPFLFEMREMMVKLRGGKEDDFSKATQQIMRAFFKKKFGLNVSTLFHL